MDSTKRSVAKAISWRVIGTLSTFVISYAISGNVTLASTVTGIQLTVNTLLYFAHERLWDRIKWEQKT